MADYIPGSDEMFEAWSANYSAVVTASAVALGLLPADAVALAALQSAFSASLSAATTPGTRTPLTVATKDADRISLETRIRALTKRIQATATVTPTQKLSLGITVPDVVRTPVPPPSTKPVVSVVKTESLAHECRMADESTPTRRSRPEGACGAEVYSFVGEEPPEDLELWRFEGLATRNKFRVAYNSADVGKTAHIVALWYNHKGQRGPRSAPVINTVAA